MATEILRPNAAGDEENITYETPDGTAHWSLVDEETPDEDTTRVYGSNDNWERDLYNIVNHSVGSGTINRITVYARCLQNSTTPDHTCLKIVIKSGSGSNPPDTVSEGSEITPANTYTNYSQQWDTNPKTGAAWTWNEIDNLQIGVSVRDPDVPGSFYNTRCTQMWVEVTYGEEATPKTSSDTGSGIDAYVSLETGEAKTSSDAGSGVEGTPLPSATLTGNDTGAGIEALIARLLAAVDTGTGTEVAQIVGLLKDLFASELGWGSDSLTAKIEMPTKGGGMKLWT